MWQSFKVQQSGYKIMRFIGRPDSLVEKSFSILPVSILLIFIHHNPRSVSEIFHNLQIVTI